MVTGQDNLWQHILQKIAILSPWVSTCSQTLALHKLVYLLSTFAVDKNESIFIPKRKRFTSHGTF